MYLVFGWMDGLPHGGANDVLKNCHTLEQANEFVDTLESSGEGWDTQIVNVDKFDILTESANMVLMINNHHSLELN